MARTSGSKRLWRGRARWEKKKKVRSLPPLPSTPPASSRRPSPRADSEPRLARASDANPAATLGPPSPDESGEVETTSVRAASAIAAQEHFTDLPVGSVPTSGTNGASADVDRPFRAEGSVPELDFELTFEHEFFLASSPPSEPPLEVEDDPEQRALTIAEYERRLWFRRHVVRLMAFLSVFVLVVLLLRLSTAG